MGVCNVLISVQLKELMAASCGLPVSDQRWMGWPLDVEDNLTLAACRLNSPHSLTLTPNGQPIIPQVSLIQRLIVPV